MPGKRETTEPKPGDKRQVRRIVNGRFASHQPAVAKSSATGQPQPSQTRTWKGQRDRGGDR
jgi:hypothetical protein